MRSRQSHAVANLTCPLAGAPLLFGVLRPGAGVGSSNFDNQRQIAADTAGQMAGAPAGPAPVPGAGGLLSPMWMPVRGIHIEFFST